MNEQQPERRRFQFGLRKLLLWTAVVALVLGAATSSAGWAWVPACWMLAIGVVRVALGPKVAGVLSVVAGMILMVCLAFVRTTILETMPVGVMVGAFFGLTMFAAAEGLYQAVNWLDNLMQTKTDD